MTDDPMPHRLRRLAVLEPDPARSERVRMRCCSALARRQRPVERPTSSRGFTAHFVESRLMYGLSVGYLVAMIVDLVRLYMAR